MRVLKFGGTSVGSPEALRSLVRVVAASAAEEPVVVVVSAMSGVTDDLVRACAGRGAGVVDSLLERHFAVLRELAGGDAVAGRAVSQRCIELARLLDCLARAGSAQGELGDRILATGERLAAPLVAGVLRAAGVAAVPLDAGDLLVSDSGFGAARVDLTATASACRSRLAAVPRGVVPVVTGFVAADGRGRTTTLGRGGSDLSAAVLGAVTGARRVEIWSDVDGVLAAPPDLVPEAGSLAEISFAEAAVLSSLGAKVLHPATVAPLAGRGIPVVVRNTFNPESPGTRIFGAPDRRCPPLRAVTVRRGLRRLRLALVGPARIAALIARLAEHRAETVAVTSAAAGETVLLVDPGPDAGAVARLRQELAALPPTGDRQPAVCEPVAVLAAVGPFAAANASTLTRVLECLSGCPVGDLSVAPGGWPHAVALVLAEDAVTPATRALYAEVVGIEGTRAVGGAQESSTALALAVEGGQ